MWKEYIKQYHYSLISAILFNRDSASIILLPNASKGNSTTIQQCTRTRATDCATFHSICSIIYIKKKLLSQQQRPAPAHYIFWNCTFCRPPLEYSKPRMSAIFNKNTLLIAHLKNFIDILYKKNFCAEGYVCIIFIPLWRRRGNFRLFNTNRCKY